MPCGQRQKVRGAIMKKQNYSSRYRKKYCQIKIYHAVPVCKDDLILKKKYCQKWGMLRMSKPIHCCTSAKWWVIKGRVARRKPPLCKKSIAVRRHLLQTTWTSQKPNGRMFCGQTRPKIGLNKERYVWRKRNIAFQHKNISSRLWNTVAVVSRSGPVLLHLCQDGLPSLT